jgi:hypothetical protein
MRTLCLLSLLIAGASGLQISKPAGAKHSGVDLAKAQAEPKPVFYLIVMGKLSFRHQVSLWLSSVRKLGGYKDEVVLVTDRPDCLAKTLAEAKLLGNKISSSEDADIYGPGEGYVGNIHMLKRPVVKKVYYMKLEKSRAWTNVKNAGISHPVSSIIYTDEDIVIAKDLKNFVSTVRELEKAKHTLALFRDTGKSFGQLHTGVVVMFPGEHTDACLARWGKKLVSKGKAAIARGHRALDVGQLQKNRALKDVINEEDLKDDMLTDDEAESMGPDQEALAATKECKAKDNDHDGIKILPADFFWFPTKHGLTSGKTAEFVHFTNTGRWKIISHETIKQYLTAIGIPEHIDPMGHVEDKACTDDAAPTEDNDPTDDE